MPTILVLWWKTDTPETKFIGNLCDFCICCICHVGCGSSDHNKREILELLCVIQPQEWSNMAVPWVYAHHSVNWKDSVTYSDALVSGISHILCLS